MLVEKPAFLRMVDFRAAMAARDRAGRVVLVGENDHYKPQAVKLRRLLADGAIGEVVFAHFTTIAKRLKTEDDWRNDETMAGGDAFFEEGIHWLHLAGSLGPKITRSRDSGRPCRGTARTGGPRACWCRFGTTTARVGSLYYSREIPSFFKGCGCRRFTAVRASSPSSRTDCSFWCGEGAAEIHLPGFYDFRGYRVMYRDFLRRIREERARDEPRARDGRSAVDGSGLREHAAHRAVTEHYDIIIIGSGAAAAPSRMGSRTARARVDPRTRRLHSSGRPELSPIAVWKDLRYQTIERWLDEEGREFRPYTHYCVGGNTKFG